MKQGIRAFKEICRLKAEYCPPCPGLWLGTSETAHAASNRTKRSRLLFIFERVLILICAKLFPAYAVGGFREIAVHIEMRTAVFLRYGVFPVQTCMPGCFFKRSRVPLETIRTNAFPKQAQTKPDIIAYIILVTNRYLNFRSFGNSRHGR
jgi:hypothetical protein